MNYYGFYTGEIFDAYQYLGAHLTENGTVFRTFAPSAERISVIGEFNDWQETPMEKTYDGNFWECHIDQAKEGMKYKYRIYRRDQTFVDHCDPYGFFMELRPNAASIICPLDSYHFDDSEWVKNRTDCKNTPLNIYEIHFGSWRKKSNEQEGWYTYSEMGDLLIPYLKENGYNYVEIMPLSEHPCDESWGYQNTGFYSPTSRYGTPEELKSFIDKCHKNNIGVLFDFVPVHFAVDDYALLNYDGTALYEYPHIDVGRSEWGSCNFMHSRGEVRSFLKSAANYWLTEFHFDGIRVDAVSNMIYWQGDKTRGQNRNAITFLQEMNQGIKELHPTAIMVAEDSTVFPNVTKPVSEGGLGFDYKWNMGWMNDTLTYFRTHPNDRIRDYHKLTFSMQYFYDDNFLLPFSHDEVVHGKDSIIQKMNGEYEEKFLQAKALYLYMFAHPGKKMNFMGNELGQIREWDEKREQDWDLLKYPIHDSFHRFMRELNHLYLNAPALYEMDYDKDGFVWLDCHQESKCIYAFERRGINQRILAVFNFSDKKQKSYSLNIPNASKLSLMIASDMTCYGGEEEYNDKEIKIEQEKVEFSLSPYCGRYYVIE